MPTACPLSDNVPLRTLLALVVCPECHGTLEYVTSDFSFSGQVHQRLHDAIPAALRCEQCQRAYPVLSDGIPVLWSDVLRDSLLQSSAESTAVDRERAAETDVKSANHFVYERVIEEYETKKIHANPATSQRLNSVLRELDLQRPGRQLDVGCGPGNVLEATSDADFDVKIGCDISLQALRMTRSKGYAVVLGDAERLPFADDQIDLVTGYSLLHHLYAPKRFMAESYRVLRDRGALVTDFDPNKHAANYGPLAMAVYRSRGRLYRFIPGARKKRFARATKELEQRNRLAEFHNAPGLGFDPEALRRELTDVGFRVRHVYLHNKWETQVESSRFTRPQLPNLVAQTLSFRNPFSRRYADAVLTASEKCAVT